MTAQAQITPNFDFIGYVPAVPAQTGGELQLLALINNNDVTATPIPLDFDAAQHTIVLRAELDDASGFAQSYVAPTIDVYTDVGPTTGADFSDPTSLQDGERILSATFSGTLNRDKYTPSLGAFHGNISWTGGTRVDELGSNTAHWTFGGGISSTTPSIPTGYVECWDGLIDQLVVAVEHGTWGGVKQLYRR